MTQSHREHSRHHSQSSMASQTHHQFTSTSIQAIPPYLFLSTNPTSFTNPSRKHTCKFQLITTTPMAAAPHSQGFGHSKPRSSRAQLGFAAPIMASMSLKPRCNSQHGVEPVLSPVPPHPLGPRLQFKKPSRSPAVKPRRRSRPPPPASLQSPSPAHSQLNCCIHPGPCLHEHRWRPRPPSISPLHPP
ncbi:hypothetical protein M0R45_016023 [Rubus argutus]|uniref:Uncharacterized protein n=1 Tax=Rubus argutus TaxID=59490 RepID=A0AAW1XTA4_RUBAR